MDMDSLVGHSRGGEVWIWIPWWDTVEVVSKYGFPGGTE
jgi:hypothetical protein